MNFNTPTAFNGSPPLRNINLIPLAGASLSKISRFMKNEFNLDVEIEEKVKYGTVYDLTDAEFITAMMNSFSFTTGSVNIYVALRNFLLLIIVAESLL